GGFSQQDSPTDSLPSCFEHNFPYLDWVEPVRRLRCLLASQNEILDNTACIPAFRLLEATYESTYGRDGASSRVSPVHKYVFRWIYCIEDNFIALLRQREISSLVILAHWALLLRTMPARWFIYGWAEHLVLSVKH